MTTENDRELITSISPPETDQDQEGLDALEVKYRQQMRQIVTQKIELPISALPAMLDQKNGQIDLNPDFQRRSIWDADRRSRFIESIIMNIPIPPVFLGETEYAKYAVLDGRQRLTAIHEFLRNNFALRKLKVWDELNGKTFNDLVDAGLDKFFVRRFVPAVIVLRESSPQVKYDVFDRLNTGGVVAEPMEIRNAVYPGKFTNLLHRLSVNSDFMRLWEIPATGPARSESAVYNRMVDLELVLRFFAVTAYEGRMKFKDFMGDLMDARNKAYASSPALEHAEAAKFERACHNAWRVFGAEAFRRPQADGSHHRYQSAPLADAVLNAVSEIPSDTLTPENCAKVRAAIDKLYLGNAEFQGATTSGTNGIGAIRKRLDLAAKAVTAALS